MSRGRSLITWAAAGAALGAALTGVAYAHPGWPLLYAVAPGVYADVMVNTPYHMSARTAASVNAATYAALLPLVVGIGRAVRRRAADRRTA